MPEITKISRQRMLHPLPQLVVRRKAVLPERILDVILVLIVLNEKRRVALDVGGRAGRIKVFRISACSTPGSISVCCAANCCVEPRLIADQSKVVDVAVGRAKGRLLQEARCIA